MGVIELVTELLLDLGTGQSARRSWTRRRETAMVGTCRSVSSSHLDLSRGWVKRRVGSCRTGNDRRHDGKGSRSQREGRQAIRGPAQEGDEQVAGSSDRQHPRRLEQGRQAQRQRASSSSRSSKSSGPGSGGNKAQKQAAGRKGAKPLVPGSRKTPSCSPVKATHASSKLDGELPDQAEPEQHADLLERVGLNPRGLVARFGGDMPTI